MIFVPYGSGRLMENYIYWQRRSLMNKLHGKKDVRLKIPTEKVISIDILGAEPEKRDSIADKLTADFKPFKIFNDEDISTLVNLSWTGENTGVYKVSEERIKQAYEILKKYCKAEPSAAAGLALYMNMYEKGKIDPKKKALVVNTGKGI